MSIGAELTFLKMIFHILHKAAEQCPTDFLLWTHHKRIFNKRLNRIVILFINARSSILDKRLLFCLSQIIKAQYKIRLNRSLNNKFIYTKQIILVWDLIEIYLWGLLNLFKSLFRLGSRYKLDYPSSNSKLVIAVKFPSHSFTKKPPGGYDAGNFPSSSFGEMLDSKYRNETNLVVVSVDEYQRKSFARDGSIEMHDQYARAIERIKLNRRRSFAALFEDISSIAKLLATHKRYPFLIFCYSLACEIRLIPYRALIAHAKNKWVLDAVYITPFDELELLADIPEILSVINVFYYSENFLIPPVSNYHSLANGEIQVDKTFLEDFSITNVTNFGWPCGYSDIINVFESASLKLFLKKDSIFSPTPISNPCVFGYETTANLQSPFAKLIAVFDVPPESLHSQLCRSLCGDMCADIAFVAEFLNDICLIGEELEIGFLYKPKYALTNYEGGYHGVIKNIMDRLGEKFILLDPYVRLGDVIESADCSINFPYTSTQKFADLYGKKSYFYIPEHYIKSFSTYDNSAIYLYGREELRRAILDLLSDE